MKKYLVLLFLALGLFAVTPKAEAGQFARVYTPYGPTYVHKSALYGGNCHGNNFRHHRNRGYGFYPYRSHRTVRSFPVYRGFPRNYYAPGYHCATNRPRFAISFGF